ncbi:MAG TPA: ATP-dependent helicase, partial [Dehalococcoidia bacterium]
VINYDIPDTPELFTHRVGRTGRMGRSGQAITLVGAADISKLQEIERGLGVRLPRVTATGEPIERREPVMTAGLRPTARAQTSHQGTAPRGVRSAPSSRSYGKRRFGRRRATA